MIRKYQNELIVLAAFLLLVVGFVYDQAMKAKLDKSMSLNQQSSQEITDTKILQKVWGSKGINKKIADLKRALSTIKIRSFDEQNNKLSFEFVGLDGKELNTVSTKLASMPVSIKNLKIVRNGDKYTMRCSCSW